MSEYIRTNEFDTNECPNIFVKEKLLRTNVRIYIRDQYIRIFKYIRHTLIHITPSIRPKHLFSCLKYNPLSSIWPKICSTVTVKYYTEFRISLVCYKTGDIHDHDYGTSFCLPGTSILGGHSATPDLTQLIWLTIMFAMAALWAGRGH